MTNFKRQLISAMAAGAMVLNLAAPAIAGTTIEISGNGSDSNNTANVTQTGDTNVTQYNNATVNNDVDVDSDTGNNDANDNTGGDVSIDTGDVNTTVTVNNTLNSNAAEVDCCPTNGDTEVLISENGTDSDNDVKLNQDKDINVTQLNYARVNNDVDVDSDTGYNDAEDNTGGSVTIETGDADTTVMISNTANSNWARVGNGDSNGGSLSVRILDNGSNSDNDINLTLDGDVTLTQWNEAKINNDVDVDSDTGNNDANDNTGGDVVIDTGDIDTDVTVDNEVNFNAADIDCGCLLDDILVKIAGNGTDSDNDIVATLGGDQDVEQTNQFSCGGHGDKHNKKCADVDIDSDTGHNDAEDNTGDPDGDPSIETGDVDNNVEVNNSGNSNAFGVDLDDLDWPDFPGFNFSFTFDLGDLLDLLNG